MMSSNLYWSFSRNIMGRRSRKHRKQFSCGHRGFGKACHRCVKDNALVHQKLVSVYQQRLAKQEWEQSFADDPVDLRGLPEHVIVKARQIIANLHNGGTHRQFKGKRFHFDRTLITIPVTYDYRMLCREHKGKLVPLKVLSHEAYNGIARNKN